MPTIPRICSRNLDPDQQLITLFSENYVPLNCRSSLEGVWKFSYQVYILILDCNIIFFPSITTTLSIDIISCLWYNVKLFRQSWLSAIVYFWYKIFNYIHHLLLLLFIIKFLKCGCIEIYAFNYIFKVYIQFVLWFEWSGCNYYYILIIYTY